MPHDASTLVGATQAELALIAWQTNERWKAGETPDAAALFQAHPELEQQKSFALDLIYDEYWLRRERGENVSREEMLGRYPHYRSSLARLLDVDHVVAGAAQEVTPERLLSVFGFERLELLGRGAFSTVFLAREPALGNRLTVVKLGLRTAEEARLGGKLNHPHVVPVWSVQRDPRYSTAAVCMPFLGRATLCDLLDARFGGPRPAALPALREHVAQRNEGVEDLPTRIRSRCYEDLVMRIGLALASALQSTHAQGVLHLDLKPSNVLLASLERPLLMDFNLSADSGNSPAASGGTLAYVAPEQLRSLLGAGRAAALDERTDLYALGALLFELLVGRPPFAMGETGPLATVGPRHLALQEAGASSLPETVAPRLARLIADCLRFAPEARPRSAAEVARRLARELSPEKVALRAARRHPRVVAGAGVAALLLALAGGAAYARRPTWEVRQLESARSAVRSGDYDEAVDRFSRALRATPADANVLCERAAAFARQGEYPLALADFGKVLERDPKHVRAVVGTAYCYSKLKNHRVAADVYGWLPASERSSLLVRNNSAVAFHGSARHVEALAELEAALVVTPDHPKLHMNRASVLMALALQRSGNVDPRAWSDVQLALRSEPPSGGLYLTAAVILSRLAEPPADAPRQMREFLRSAIEHGMAYDNLMTEPFLTRWLTDEDRTALAAVRARPNCQAFYDGLMSPF